jgi:hypothetical protein
MDAPGYSTIRLGAPPAGLDARAEIARLRAAGYGPTVIARTLNARGVATPTGRGIWWPETVKRHVDPLPWRAYMRAYRGRHSPGRIR